MTRNAKQFIFTRDLGLLLVYANTHNIVCTIREVRRFHDRQEQLYKDGKSQTLKSYHLDSLAADIIIFVNDKPLWDGDNPLYQQMGRYWEHLGHVWGGRWSFNDAVHFQY